MGGYTQEAQEVGVRVGGLGDFHVRRSVGWVGDMANKVVPAVVPEVNQLQAYAALFNQGVSFFKRD